MCISEISHLNQPYMYTSYTYRISNEPLSDYKNFDKKIKLFSLLLPLRHLSAVHKITRLYTRLIPEIQLAVVLLSRLYEDLAFIV